MMQFNWTTTVNLAQGGGPQRYPVTGVTLNQLLSTFLYIDTCVQQVQKLKKKLMENYLVVQYKSTLSYNDSYSVFVFLRS